MSIDRAFRRSFYLTLALASVCLGYAVRPHVPESLLLTLVTPLLLLAAYLLDGRWTLPVWLANVLGLLIVALMGCWVAPLFLDAANDRLEWVLLPTRLMPFLGALWLAFLLTLPFHSRKQRGYLSLHGIAFIGVALACTLDSDFLFGVLLTAYLVCGLWSLSLFHLYRGRIAARMPGVSNDPVPWRGLGVGRVLLILLLLTPPAIAGFLLTPRYSLVPTDSPLAVQAAYQTGVGEAVMDLNRTGTLKLNTEVAFEVDAENANGEPKLDLPADQRWRGIALNYYDRGRWFNHGLTVIPMRVGSKTPEDYVFDPNVRVPDHPREELPDLGPEAFFLTVSFPQRAPRRAFLAEPVVLPGLPRDRRMPVAFFGKPLARPWGNHLDMEVLLPAAARHKEHAYVQETVPPPAPDLSSPLPDFDLAKTPLHHATRVPGLYEWTGDVLHGLVAEGRLRAADLRTGPDGWLLTENYEKVGRALEAYLATSGEYTYSLQFTRSNLRIDPTFDFLRNVRQGHCERFAGGLALMLRSQGIPARIVVGFRGAESLGGGKYQVRHSDAHSWVEMLVQRPGPQGPRWHWLTLDPTPSEDLVAAGPWWLRWWREIEQHGGGVWGNYVTEYTPEQRERTVAEAWKGLAEATNSVPGGLPVLSVLLLAVLTLMLWLRRARRKRNGPSFRIPEEPAFYGRWLRLIARRCRLWPEPVQTAHEFAEVVRQRLHSLPTTAALANVPADVARLYYRVRFAARPLDAAEQAEVERRLGQLDATLQDG